MNANNSNYITEQGDLPDYLEWGDLPDYLEWAEFAAKSDRYEQATAYAMIAQAQDQRRQTYALERIVAVLEAYAAGEHILAVNIGS